MAIWAEPRAKGAHPLMHELTELLRNSAMGQDAVTAKAGVCRGALREWRHDGHDPKLGSFDAVLNVLGYKLAVVPLEPAE